MQAFRVGLVNFRTEEDFRGFIHDKNEGILTGIGIQARRFIYLFLAGTWLNHQKIASLIEQKAENHPKKLNEVYATLFRNARLSRELEQKIDRVRQLVLPPPPSRPTLEEVRGELVSCQTISECKSGALPPIFCYRGSQKPMRPPVMHPLEPPSYYYGPPQLAPQHAYEMDDERKKLRPHEQINFFLGMLTKLKSDCDAKFSKAQSYYTTILSTLRSLTPTKILEASNTLSSMNLEYLHPRIDAKAHRGMIRQINNDSSAHASVQANASYKSIIAQASWIQEASDYLKAYAKWLEKENSSTKVLADPLHLMQEVQKYTAPELASPYGYWSYDKKGNYLLLHNWARKNESVAISKLNASGKWELIPIYVDEGYYDHDDSRYPLQAILEQGTTYRVDIAQMRRTEDAQDKVTTEKADTRTFLLDTSST